MKISYLADFKKEEPTTISKILTELGHKVTKYDVYTVDPKKFIDETNKRDMLIFHDLGIDTDKEINELNFAMGMAGAIQLLQAVECKKTMIVTEKITGLKEAFIYQIMPLVDCAFLSDDTWLRRKKIDNAYPFHWGAEQMPEGKEREEYKYEIAILGKVYDYMVNDIKSLKKQYGQNLKLFSDMSEQDYTDLAKNAQMIICLEGGKNDFYWDSDIYKVLASGGFLIYPRLEGIREEGIKNGTHYAGYHGYMNLVAAIEFFLKPENGEIREELAKNGQDYVLKNCLLEDKLKEMIKICKNQK